MSLISIIAFSQNKFSEGELDPTEAYIWVAIAYNISIAIALFSLMLFYVGDSQPYLFPVLVSLRFRFLVEELGFCAKFTAN